MFLTDGHVDQVTMAYFDVRKKLGLAIWTLLNYCILTKLFNLTRPICLLVFAH